MESFCDENHLSKDLKKRLKRALEYNSSKGILSNKEKNELLREIPGDLLFEV